MGLSKVNYCVLCAGLLLGSSVAAAQGWRIGAGIGSASVDLSDVEDRLNESAETANSIGGITASVSVDDTDTGIRLFGGYDPIDYLTIEFGYADLGEASVDFVAEDNGSATGNPGTYSVSGTSSVSGLYTAAVGRLPLSDLVSLNGRLGMFLWDLEEDYSEVDDSQFSSFSYSESSSDDGTDLLYGIGLDIGFFGLFYEIYEVDDDDVEMIGASASFRF